MSILPLPPPSVLASQIPVSERMARLYRQGLLIRAVEERLLALFSQGRLHGTVHTCIGQEWTGVAVAEFLLPGDFVFSNHRCHGHYLARTDDVEGLIAEVMGKQTGVCGGRGGSQHLCRDGFFSNGIQGGIVPVSAGLALSQKLKGTDNLTVVFIGDGTLGEGAVYETLNVASKWKLPLLIVLENNLYSQSTLQRETLAGDICARAEAFDVPAFRADTWNPESLLSITENCISKIREGHGPVFLQIDTYRLMAHSKGDDDRDLAEIANYRDRDPLCLFTLRQPEMVSEINRLIRLRLDAAVAAADDAERADVASEIRRAKQSANVDWGRAESTSPERSVTLIQQSLERALERDARVVLIGEDIESPYGGAFKATQGLSHRFPSRVRNTPISESLIVGLGNGLALAGMRPVCEIMFGDFITLAADQLINHASKFRFMYNDQVNVPLIVRTPMGGRRGYGPTHSQSLEKHFLGLPDLQVLATNHRLSPGLVYDRLMTSIDGPTLVIENKVLYGQRVQSEIPDGFVLEYSSELFPSIRIRPERQADVTVVCYGEMLREVEDAVIRVFDEHEIICEVICPTRLSPLNITPILSSVSCSRRLLVVEEGIGCGGFGSEVIARLVETDAALCQRVKRLASPEYPIPACVSLEREMLPHSTSIVAALRELMSDE